MEVVDDGGCGTVCYYVERFVLSSLEVTDVMLNNHGSPADAGMINCGEDELFVCCV